MSISVDVHILENQGSTFEAALGLIFLILCLRFFFLQNIKVGGGKKIKITKKKISI